MLAKVMSLASAAAAMTGALSAPPVITEMDPERPTSPTVRRLPSTPPAPRAYIPASPTSPSPAQAAARAITQPSVNAHQAADAPLESPIAPGIVLMRPFRLDPEHLKGVPGVEIKFLPSPGPGCLRCAIVRMAPGSVLPARDIPGGEALHVVEGFARFADVVAYAGDVCHAESGTVHVAIRTDDGCLLFVVAPDEGEDSGAPPID